MTDRELSRDNFRWFGVRLVAAAGLLAVAHSHWPVVPLMYSVATRARPSQEAVRYVHCFWFSQPVVRGLARGSIREGQPVDEVVARYGPFDVETVGRYQLLSAPRAGFSFEGWGILARDGKLVHAVWYTCTAHVTYFDALLADEHRDCWEQVQAHRDRVREDRHRARMAAAGAAGVHAGPLADDYRRDGERLAGMAAAGSAGFIACYEPPSEGSP